MTAKNGPIKNLVAETATKFDRTHPKINRVSDVFLPNYE